MTVIVEQSMKSKILIIDIDPQTIISLSWFIAILNLEPVVVHNWPSNIKSLKKEELKAVFVDVELASVKLDQISQSFGKAQANGGLLLFYLYSRTFAPRYQKAQQQQSYTKAFKKPVKLEKVYYALQEHIDFDELHSFNSDSNAKLAEFINFSSNFKEWLKKLSQILQIKGAV